MVIKLIVGLGNPGEKYERTRHNVGYRVIDEIQNQPSADAWLLKPESVFMNESGGPVSQMARKKGIAPEELLVVCDDFTLPLGRLRLRLKGSSGGHNGLDSILTVLGTTEIPRLRVGIGPVPESQDPADFVLQRFAKSEQQAIDQMIVKAAEAVQTILSDGLDRAMNRYNSAEK